SSRRRHTRSKRDWSSDVCSSDLICWPVVSTSVERINGVKPPKIAAPILYTSDSVRNLTLVWNILGNTEGITPSNVDINNAMINRSEERRVGKKSKSQYKTNGKKG